MITGVVKDKIEDTTNKAVLSVKGSAINQINDSIEEVAMLPHNLYHEVRRNMKVETTGAFNKSPNESTYDYFNNYYEHYNHRYNPTPTSNLAEVLHYQEKRSRELRRGMYR